MPEPQILEAEAAKPLGASTIIDREAGLHRNLSARQLSMIAVGGAIGTGLFLGSAVSVRVAGRRS